jgi:hypothetical protein
MAPVHQVDPHQTLDALRKKAKTYRTPLKCQVNPRPIQ